MLYSYNILQENKHFKIITLKTTNCHLWSQIVFINILQMLFLDNRD